MRNNIRFLKAIFILVLTLLLLLPSGNLLASSYKAPSQLKKCECLEYFQKLTGLPKSNGDASGGTYASWLSKQKGYSVSYLKADSKNPVSLYGSYISWSGSRMKNSAGHIALLRTASYNKKTKEWTFIFLNTNWEGTVVSKVKDPVCNNVVMGKQETKDLSGITFFKVKKK